MNRLLKAQVALEGARAALGELLDLETRGETFDTDLDTAKNKVSSMQKELSAAAMLEPSDNERRSETVDSEELELRSQMRKANVGRIFEAAVKGETPTGAEREIQQHFKIGAHSIPVSLLAALETRAAATITGDEPSDALSVLGEVFPMPAAAFMGVMVETVPAGEKTYPVITTGATAAALAKSASGKESTAALTVTSLTPKRAQASLRYTREDAAAFPYLDAGLRENLTMALGAKLESEILVRASHGLIRHGTDPAVNVTAVTNFKHAIANLYGSVDGKFASMVSECRLLIGTRAYANLAAELVNASASESLLAIEKIGQVCGGVRVSGHIPPFVTSSAAFEDALIAIGPPRRNAVAAVWENLDLVVDPYTAAEEGEVVITAYMLQDSAVVRSAGYRRLRFK